jgi:WD40 repeat protein
MATDKCEALAELRGHPGSITSVAFSPDGTHIVSASYDNSLRIWNTVTGKCEAELIGHSSRCLVTSVVLSTDGTYMSSTSYDKSLKMDVVASEPEAELMRHPGSITSVAFSPDGTYIVSASYDKSLQVWNTVTGECEAELRGHPGLITSVAFSPNGTCVVSASDNKSLQLWNVLTGDFTVFGDHMEFSNGVQIHCYNDSSIYFSYAQHDQSTPLPLLEIDGSHILHRSTGQCCWIPSHLRHHTAVAYNMSRVCLGLDMGDVLVVEVRYFYFVICYKSHKQILTTSLNNLAFAHICRMLGCSYREGQ